MTGQTGQPKTVNDTVTWSRFDGTGRHVIDRTGLPCDNTALVLVLLAMCEGRERTNELSCLSVSYCYLHSFTFRKSNLINIIFTLCVVSLGLSEAASAAISCPVSAVLDYRYADIFKAGVWLNTAPAVHSTAPALWRTESIGLMGSLARKSCDTRRIRN